MQLKKQVLWSLFFLINLTFPLFSGKNKNQKVQKSFVGFYKIQDNFLLLKPQSPKKSKNKKDFYEKEISKGTSLKALQRNPDVFQHSSDSERSVKSSEDLLPPIPW